MAFGGTATRNDFRCGFADPSGTSFRLPEGNRRGSLVGRIEIQEKTQRRSPARTSGTSMARHAAGSGRANCPRAVRPPGPDRKGCRTSGGGPHLQASARSEQNIVSPRRSRAQQVKPRLRQHPSRFGKGTLAHARYPSRSPGGRGIGIRSVEPSMTAWFQHPGRLADVVPPQCAGIQGKKSTRFKVLGQAVSCPSPNLGGA